MNIKPTYEELRQRVQELEEDLGRLRQAEGALRANEEKYRTILENIEDGYFEVDLRGNLIFFTDPFCKMFGYTKDELVGLNYKAYMDEKNAIRVFEAYKRVFDTGESIKRLEYAIAKDGVQREVESSITLIRDSTGQPAGFRGIIRDVSERKRMEEALRESEEKYRNILESIEDGYYEVDFAGNFTSVNDAVCRILGYSKDELLGMNNRQYTDRETSKKVYKEYNKVQITGSPKKRFEYDFIRKDGSKGQIESSVSLMNDIKGQPIGFRGIARDVSERKLIEREKQELEGQLQRSQKMEAIGTLAGGVAHDLNNILSGLVSYPELILMDLPEDSHLRKPIKTIHKSGQKAAAIVQDLLTLARRGVSVTEVVNLNPIISEYLNSPEHEKLKSFHPNVTCEINLEAGLLNVLGSPVHLSKTIMNMVSNAAEAMPDGGMIFISTENRYIEKPIAGYDNIAEGDYVIVKMIDTGIGISSEDMGRIFEPFYTKKIMGRSGTGLGMAVVWGTVKDHKGYIDVQSTKGKGTTFTLYFPVTRKELTKTESSISIEDYMGHGESILIVDDVEEQRVIASDMLKKLGYSVISLSSGEKAVEYMKDNSADLLVLDMIMDPGIDGLETYKRIVEIHPNQKAVIASGFSETARVKKAQGLGAGQYIKKPYALEKIGLAVKEELELRE
ncbi:MAG: PAS domain S-box protein [Pseudomonadota bacterium]